MEPSSTPRYFLWHKTKKKSCCQRKTGVQFFTHHIQFMEQNMHLYTLTDSKRLAEEIFKFGNHKGTEEALRKRYITSMPQMIICDFISCQAAKKCERTVLNLLDSYRVLNDNGNKSEWIHLPLLKLRECITDVMTLFNKWDKNTPTLSPTPKRKRKSPSSAVHSKEQNNCVKKWKQQQNLGEALLNECEPASHSHEIIIQTLFRQCRLDSIWIVVSSYLASAAAPHPTPAVSPMLTVNAKALNDEKSQPEKSSREIVGENRRVIGESIAMCPPDFLRKISMMISPDPEFAVTFNDITEWIFGEEAYDRWHNLLRYLSSYDPKDIKKGDKKVRLGVRGPRRAIIYLKNTVAADLLVRLASNYPENEKSRWIRTYFTFTRITWQKNSSNVCETNMKVTRRRSGLLNESQKR